MSTDYTSLSLPPVKKRHTAPEVCALCAMGMNSFTDPYTCNRIHARNGVVTLCPVGPVSSQPEMETRSNLPFGCVLVLLCAGCEVIARKGATHYKDCPTGRGGQLISD